MSIISKTTSLFKELINGVFQGMVNGQHVPASRDAGMPVPQGYSATWQDERQQRVWAATKAVLLEGSDLDTALDGTAPSNRRQTLAVLLDNLHCELMSHNQTSNQQGLMKILPPITRRVFSGLLTNDLIGVQPMSGPVSHVHTQRVCVRPEQGDYDLTGFDEIVPSKARKLAARWVARRNVDAATQKSPTNRIIKPGQKYLEAEAMAASAQEIAADIDEANLRWLHGIAGTPASTFDVDGLEDDALFVGDVHAALADMIRHRANVIAARTRRYAGNKIVVSALASTILQSATNSAFSRLGSGTGRGPFIGTLYTNKSVYINYYAKDNEPVLITYKGSDTDAGAFYAPYVLVGSGGVVISPEDREPVVSFTTRCGSLALRHTATTIAGAADYFGSIAIRTDNLSFV